MTTVNVREPYNDEDSAHGLSDDEEEYAHLSGDSYFTVLDFYQSHFNTFQEKCAKVSNIFKSPRDFSLLLKSLLEMVQTQIERQKAELQQRQQENAAKQSSSPTTAENSNNSNVTTSNGEQNVAVVSSSEEKAPAEAENNETSVIVAELPASSLSPSAEQEQLDLNQKFFIYTACPNFVRNLLDNSAVEGDLISAVQSFIFHTVEMYTNEWQLYNKNSITFTKNEKGDVSVDGDAVQRVLRVIDVLEILFDGRKCPFYQNGLYHKINLANHAKDLEKYGTNPPEKNWLQHYKEYHISTPPPKSSKLMSTISCHYIKNANHFGYLGGFKTLMEWLDTEKIELSVLTRLLTMYGLMMESYHPKVLDDTVPKVREKIANYIMSLDDESMKTNEKQALTDLVRILAYIVKRHTPTKVHEFTEGIMLELAFKFMNSKIIEKRCQGLADLKAIFRETQEDENKKSSGSKYFGGVQASTKWLTKKYLFKWMEDRQLFECLFKDIHPEAIRQSRAILLYIANCRDFKQTEVEVMWKSAVGKHEATQRQIYDLIISLLPSLKMPVVNMIYECIEEIPLKSLNNHTLQFIKDFAIEAVINSGKIKEKKKKCYGLDLIWGIAQDNNEVNPVLAEKALELMMELLEREEFEAQRKKFMKLCVANVKANFSVPQSLSLLLKLISTYPQTPKKKKGSVWAMIDYLNEKYKILDVIFEDLLAYKKKAKADYEAEKKNEKKESKKVQQPGETTTINDHFSVESLKLIKDTQEPTAEQKQNSCSKYPHKHQLSIRLDFLSFIIKYSGLLLTFDHCSKLWKALHEECLNHDEKETIITWLTNARASAGQEYFAEGVTEKVFNEIIRNMKVENVQDCSFKLFYSFFTHLNVKNQKLSVLEEDVDASNTPLQIETGRCIKVSDIIKASSTKPNTVRVKRYIAADSELLGEDYMWKLVLNCMNHEVASKAIKILNNFKHDYVQTVQNLAVLREAYLKVCFEKISAASTQYKKEASPEVELQIVRCLELLEDYVNLFSDRSAVKSHAVSSSGYPIQVKFVVVDGPKFKRSFQSNEKVTKLWQAASSEIKHPPNFIKLYTLGKEILPEEQALDELQFKDNQVILIKKLDFKDVGLDLVKFQLKALGLGLVAEALSKQIVENFQHRIRNPSLDEKALAIDTHLQEEKEETDADFVVVPTLDDETYPTKILSRDEYFNTLMSMFSLSDDISQKAWSLLLHLPTNENMSKSLKNMFSTESQSSAIAWEEIIPTASIHKLLYCLQIIDLNIKQNKSKHENFDLKSWSEKFVVAGGLQHLIGILLKSDYESFSRTQLHKECFALLLKIIGEFLPSFAGQKKNTELLDEIVNKLLVIAPELVLQNKPLTPNSTASPRLETALKISLMEQKIVEQVVALLYHVMNADYATFEKVLNNHTQFGQFLVNSLLLCEYKEIRHEVSCGLQKLIAGRKAEEDKSIKANFVQLLMSFIPLLKKHENNCEEYFSLLEVVLGDEKLRDFDETAALVEFLSMLLKRPIIEKSSEDKEDKVMIGLLNVSKVLLRMNEGIKEKIGSSAGAGLVSEIFHSFLFDVPSGTRIDNKLPPKCKTRGSRKAAFSLLVELVTNCPHNFEELISLVIPFLAKSERHSDSWSFSPDSFEKSALGFVGLRNLGATCYMNSLIQQFFMTIPFRKGLFSANIAEPSKTDNTILLFQLQTMFGYLQDSAKKFFDTRPFCTSYKDIEGNPVRTDQQQDANEFFNLFLDKIEDALKGSEQERLLKQVYGGVIINQLVYEDQISETPEPYFILSLEIKNKKNILESLDLYTHGEMLEGDNKYYSEKLQKHVDALKRACIKELPNVLILHLKRFEYNFEKMQNVKINDRCEFYQELDMYPYTQEGIYEKEGRNMTNITKKEPSYYKYRLAGVLVHFGSADSGHYYSYIMDRSNPSQKWYEFNDKNIHNFSIDDLEKTCFGGYEEVVLSEGKTTTRQRHYRRHNAYMLFYQRETLFEEQMRATEAVTPSISIATTSSTEEEEKRPATVESLRSLVQHSIEERRKEMELLRQSEMPLVIKQAVWEDNSRFFQDKHFYNVEFDAFMWNLTNSNPSPALFQPAVKYVIDILSHSKLAENSSSCRWFELLQNIAEKDSHCCTWLLESFTANTVWRSEMLLKCPHDSIRQGFVNLLTMCVKRVTKAQLEKPQTPETASPFDNTEEAATTTVQNLVTDVPEVGSPTTTAIKTPAIIIISFIEAILSLLYDCRFYYRNATELFQFLYNIAQNGFAERKYFIEREVISMLVLLLNGEQPDPSKAFGFGQKPKSAFWSLSTTFGKTALHHILALISFLVRCCETNTSKPPNPAPPTIIRSSAPLELLASDRDKLFYKPFFASLIEEGVNLKALQDILVHWCWMHKPISLNFANLCVEYLKPQALLPSEVTTAASLTVSTGEGYQHFLQVIDALIQIDDTIAVARTEEILTHLLKHVRQISKQQIGPMKQCLRFILRVVKTNERAKKWHSDFTTELQELCHENSIEYSFKSTSTTPKGTTNASTPVAATS